MAMFRNCPTVLQSVSNVAGLFLFELSTVLLLSGGADVVDKVRCSWRRLPFPGLGPVCLG